MSCCGISRSVNGASLDDRFGARNPMEEDPRWTSRSGVLRAISEALGAPNAANEYPEKSFPNSFAKRFSAIPRWQMKWDSIWPDAGKIRVGSDVLAHSISPLTADFGASVLTAALLDEMKPGCNMLKIDRNRQCWRILPA